jgi:hypothetical protein
MIADRCHRESIVLKIQKIKTKFINDISEYLSSFISQAADHKNSIIAVCKNKY